VYRVVDCSMGTIFGIFIFIGYYQARRSTRLELQLRQPSPATAPEMLVDVS